ncbi:aromatic amino acid lyase [Streptomyces sp. NBC_01571]|uniref:aromatic amino acid ammonia-lyase n=1 Tax=Streptomyces sp. NBC_01571 TaxID=2975883 RepID=UPI0022549D40|nr:aromatic amino acid ammonia-lyase [Streptomyces sp. NBC_01571]MCX4572788.1 aromatic amino acid lyase [Streptomyces sp. NBC_01571]
MLEHTAETSPGGPRTARPRVAAPPAVPGEVALMGHGLDARAVARIAGGASPATLRPAALEGMERSHLAGQALAAEGTRAYGRTTGVGAHRGVTVEEHDGDGHDLRLLLSHAGGIGERLPVRQVRAMMAVRANQLLAGGSGLRPAIAMAVLDALRAGVHPPVSEYGAVGTGDLTALAELGLALFGHGPWEHDRADGGEPLPEPLRIERGDVLALLSSNALTLGQSALACHDLDALLRAAHVVAALSLCAINASLEAYAPEVHLAHPHPPTQRAAARVRRLLGASQAPWPPSPRVQDPFGFRCFPQAHGPATEAWSTLDEVLTVDLNSAVENPLVGWDGAGVSPVARHHGGFFATPLTLALDGVCLAVLGTARLSAARLSGLGRPELTGLRSYLADGASAGSGMMILEYSAAAAVAEVQACAAPAALGHVVLSQGTEEAASFATQAARKTLRLTDAYRLVLGCELVAAVRALRQRGTVPDPLTPAGRAYARAAAVLNPAMEDRSLTSDVASAAALLTEFAAAVGHTADTPSSTLL